MANDVDVLLFIREKTPVSACDHTRVCYEFVMLKCLPRILVSFMAGTDTDRDSLRLTVLQFHVRNDSIPRFSF